MDNWLIPPLEPVMTSHSVAWHLSIRGPLVPCAVLLWELVLQLPNITYENKLSMLHYACGKIWFLSQILFFDSFSDIDWICGSLMAISKHTAKTNSLHYPILIFSFPPYKEMSYKSGEIRKQSLKNEYFKELPRKNWDFSSPHGKSYRVAACPRSPRTTSWAHMLCWVLYWLIQKLQGKITKVPKSKMKVKGENEVRITVTTFQQLHK